MKWSRGFGGMPEVGEGELHTVNDLSNAFEDYLFDDNLAENGSVLDYGSHKFSRLESSGSGYPSQGFSSLGIVDLSTATYPALKCQNNTLDNGTFDLRGTARSRHEFDRSVDRSQHTSINMESGVPPIENEKQKNRVSGTSGSTNCTLTSMRTTKDSRESKVQNIKNHSGRGTSAEVTHDASQSGKSPVQKRLRKPIQRYIDEFPYQKARREGGKGKRSTTASGNKSRGIRSQNEHQRVTFGALTLVSRSSVNGGASNFGLQAQNGRDSNFGLQVPNDSPENSASISEHNSDEDSSATESENEGATRARSASASDRRKSQRMWTLSEVTKLVDGVSQFGVGRWTNIKRLLFSSSAYRTPIDLRDKWRNLLKASRTQLARSEVERKCKSQLLPKSLLQRVGELAASHPYPRECKSRSSHVDHIPSFKPKKRIMPNCT